MEGLEFPDCLIVDFTFTLDLDERFVDVNPTFARMLGYEPLELTGKTVGVVGMGNTGTATNYTISVSSITGTANITIYWRER